MFFQSPLTPSTVQFAQQVLQGVRQAGAGQFGQNGAAGNPVSSSILAPTPTFPQAFLQPHGFSQRSAAAATSSSLLSGITQSATGTNSSNAATRTTPGQMLDLYYSSLCQPAFPNITENPVLSCHNPPTIHLIAGESPGHVSAALFAGAVQPAPESAAAAWLWRGVWHGF
jgi:hypothetical protein